MIEFIPTDQDKKVAQVIRRLSEEKPIMFYQQMKWGEDRFIWNGPPSYLYREVSESMKHYHFYDREKLTFDSLMRDRNSLILRLAIRGEIWLEPYVEKTLMYDFTVSFHRLIYFSHHPWDEDLYHNAEKIRVVTCFKHPSFLI